MWRTAAPSLLFALAIGLGVGAVPDRAVAGESDSGEAAIQAKALYRKVIRLDRDGDYQGALDMLVRYRPSAEPNQLRALDQWEDDLRSSLAKQRGWDRRDSSDIHARGGGDAPAPRDAGEPEPSPRDVGEPVPASRDVGEPGPAPRYIGEPEPVHRQVAPPEPEPAPVILAAPAAIEISFGPADDEEIEVDPDADADVAYAARAPSYASPPSENEVEAAARAEDLTDAYADEYVSEEVDADEAEALDLDLDEKRAARRLVARASLPNPAGPVLILSGSSLAAGFGVAAGMTFSQGRSARAAGDQAVYENVRPRNNAAFALTATGGALLMSGVTAAIIDAATKQARKTNRLAEVRRW